MNTAARLPYFYEGVFQSPGEYTDPQRDVEAHVELIAPSGRRRVVPAFWDGGRVWRFRVDADEPGVWSYSLKVSDGSEEKWLGARSKFRVQPYAGPNPLYRHGPVRVAHDGTHLVHRDGTPFFWLADTAWNGLLKADPVDWEWYLAQRREQGFTAVQCVMTHWRACPADSEGEPAFWGAENIRINPAFFRRMDRKVAAIARHGLVPALVVLWALKPVDPGVFLSEKDAILLARYIVARYGAYRPVWFLGGDGLYHQDPKRWRRIGAAVFGDAREGYHDQSERAVTTLHPGGGLWVAEEFRDEPWYDFVGYQSGHGGESFRWIYDGPPSREWDKAWTKPVINLEPCYEEHLQYGSEKAFHARDVRAASYYSLFASPTAGVSYGHNAIWPWNEQLESPLDHWGAGIAGPWREAVHSPGAASMSSLKHILEKLAWWRLRPAPQLVVKQDGHEKGEAGVEDTNGEQTEPALSHVAAAMAFDGSFALLYFPRRRPVVIDRAPFVGGKATWIEPATAQVVAVESLGSVGGEFVPPREGDWLLLLQK